MKKILKTGTLAMAVSLTAFMTSCGDFLDITPLNAVAVSYTHLTLPTNSLV